jgi:hypothetical protein
MHVSDCRCPKEVLVPPVFSQSLTRPGLLAVLALGVTLTACQPTVRVEAPKDPIVINLNVKIEQEVRVKLEKDVEELLESDDAIF